ncbi:MAG: hypothetical protein ACRDZO_10100 [Egibacteraceae bacterium]
MGRSTAWAGMLTVALIGADGAGKTTVARHLARVLDVPVTYLYMGVNLEASGLMLPTTRLALALKRRAGGQPDMTLGSGRPRPVPSEPCALRPVRICLKSALRTVNWIAEEGFRESVAWYHHRRGRVVLCDRHFLPDYYAHDVTRVDPARPVASRVHGFFLRQVFPRPDLVVMLDAPAEVLHARKPSGSIEFLESRRAEYLQVREAVDRFEVVDATQPLPVVITAVADLIRHAYQERRATRR